MLSGRICSQTLNKSFVLFQSQLYAIINHYVLLRSVTITFKIKFVLTDGLLDFSSKFNKCYCVDCHGKRNESHFHSEGLGSQNVYTKPIGWGRIMLQLPPRAQSLKIFPDWNVAYHGTTIDSVIPILNSGMLLIPGNFNTIITITRFTVAKRTLYMLIQ